MKKILTTVIALGFATAMANAAVISISTTAPTTDGLDEWNYSAPTGSQKWFDDVEHNAGQTFTPAGDGFLNSFTIYLAQQNNNDAGDENVDLIFGTVDRSGGGFTLVQSYVENAPLAPSPGGDWAANDYITFSFDTPQAVTSGVEYYIITDAIKMGGWQAPAGGIPYRHTTGNTYAGGVLINRGGQISNNDVYFHADIAAIPEPGTLGLLAVVGFAFLLYRRRK